MKKLVGVYSFIFLILVAVFVYEYNKPQPVDWTPHLKSNSSSPFGQKILIHHLEDIFDTVDVVSSDFFTTAMQFEAGEPEILPLEPTERTRHTRTTVKKKKTAIDSLISSSFDSHLYNDSAEVAVEYEEEASEVQEQDPPQEEYSDEYSEPEHLVVNEKARNSAYIISNTFFSVDETDFFSLFTYVAGGRTVFISTEKFSPELAMIFQLQTETGTLNTDTMTMGDLKNRSHELKVNRHYKDLFPKDKYYVSKVLSANYFKLDEDCVADTVLVNQTGQPVLLAYACGKGKIYLSSMPLLFTNLEVLHGNRDLLAAMLSLVPKGKIYWDDYYKRHHRRFSRAYGEYQRGDGYVRKTTTYDQESRGVDSREHRGGESSAYRPENERNYNRDEDDQEDKGILSFLLENDSLRWAWYTLMVTLALYMLSSTRRRQKLIPLIHKLQNTSVEFVQMIARLYYLKKDHRDIALKKINYFQEYLRSRYYHKDLSLTESNIDSLARRSHKKPEQIKRLFELINEVQSSGSISAVKLHVLSQRINEFKSST